MLGSISDERWKISLESNPGYRISRPSVQELTVTMVTSEGRQHAITKEVCVVATERGEENKDYSEHDG